MTKPKPKIKTCDFHRFIDEAGDMTFFGKGKIDILGTNGVSKSFILGMAHIKMPLREARKMVDDFCREIEQDKYFNQIPSVLKRINAGGFYLHAKDDPPELRYKFFMFLSKEISFSLQAIVGRKDASMFVRKHNSSEQEFYADLLSHLLKDKANYKKMVVNIAQRGSSTRLKNLENALTRAQERHAKKQGQSYSAEIKFNVQPYRQDPLLSIADYGLWAIQRVFEKGETRFYDAISSKLPVILDLYDFDNYSGYKNYYGPKNPLTKVNVL